MSVLNFLFWSNIFVKCIQRNLFLNIIKLNQVCIVITNYQLFLNGIVNCHNFPLTKLRFGVNYNLNLASSRFLCVMFRNNVQHTSGTATTTNIL